jgi:hypothetical protein
MFFFKALEAKYLNSVLFRKSVTNLIRDVKAHHSICKEMGHANIFDLTIPSPLLHIVLAPKQKCKNNFDFSAIDVTVVLLPWRRFAPSARPSDANKVTLGATSARAHATAHYSPRSALHHLQGKTIGPRAKCSINTLARLSCVCRRGIDDLLNPANYSSSGIPRRLCSKHKSRLIAMRK